MFNHACYNLGLCISYMYNSHIVQAHTLMSLVYAVL